MQNNMINSQSFLSLMEYDRDKEMMYTIISYYIIAYLWVPPK